MILKALRSVDHRWAIPSARDALPTDIFSHSRSSDFKFSKIECSWQNVKLLFGDKTVWLGKNSRKFIGETMNKQKAITFSADSADIKNDYRWYSNPCPQRTSNVQSFEITAVPIRGIGLNHWATYWRGAKSRICVNAFNEHGLESHLLSFLTFPAYLADD